MGTVNVGVIEWEAEAAEAPTVVVAVTRERVAREVLGTLLDRVDDGGTFHQDDAQKYYEANRINRLTAGNEEVIDWLEGFQAVATVPWITMYEREVLV